VDAEEGAVEAQAEDDLGESREQQQQRQDAVVRGRQVRCVERDEEEVDEVREDVGGAVQRRVGRELLEMPAERQTRPLSDVK
jgi:hypothetical protein